jgi:hypothetical protein
MNTKTKTAILTVAALVMTAGSSMAAPRHYDHKHGKSVTSYERAAIQRSRAKVAAVKALAWRDGKVTFLERVQIRNAERQLAAAIARARRT